MSSVDVGEPIIVVGAGVAGLTAAQSLATSGVATVVFEAHSSVGGRVRTQTAEFGAELGAEFVHPGSRAVTAMCRELGIELRDGIQRCDSVTVNRLLVPDQLITGDARVPAAVVDSVAAEFDSALVHVAPTPHETVAQWLRRARLSEAARSVLGAVSRALTQLDPSRVDACALTSTYGGYSQRLLGGAQRLPEALAKDLDVRLNSPVAMVRQRRGAVIVTLDSGDTITSTQAVIAVAPTVLGTIGFDPPLPAVTTAAAASGPRAHGGKVVARYRDGEVIRAALSGGVITDGTVNRAWVSDPELDTDHAIVTGLICGTDRAVLERHELALIALDRVVHAATRCHPIRTDGVIQNWSADPYVLGAGGVPPTALRGEQVAILAAPERRLHFAGAHTDEAFCDTIEGAVRSGQRAAAEVLRHPARFSAGDCNDRLVRA